MAKVVSLPLNTVRVILDIAVTATAAQRPSNASAHSNTTVLVPALPDRIISALTRGELRDAATLNVTLLMFERTTLSRWCVRVAEIVDDHLTRTLLDASATIHGVW